MGSRRVDFYKHITGRDFDHDFRIPETDEIFAKMNKARHSKYPLRLLGKGYKDLYITEEEREVNFHVIGGSRQGKSKFLEYNIRKDIDMGFGLCLIDPSDFGATFNAVLDYCVSVNHPKVCIIDPNMLYDYGSVACIQPLNPEYPTKSAQSVKDSVNMLLGSSEQNTPRIQENLTALMRMLATENLTIHEAGYFADYEVGKDNPPWKQILERAKSRDAGIIRDKFSSYGYWKSEFTTTVTRLGIFRTEPLALMIGGSPGIDFNKMIEEGWVILCNLFPEPYLDHTTSTFLGILVISQIIQAVDAMKRKHGDNWKQKFYLYIDEAGSFATPQIKLLLDNKSKSGLHLIFAHHHFEQFRGQSDVLASILHNTGVKVMFAVRDHDDRSRMMKLMGFENPAAASHTYANLPKQHAVIKKNKEHALEVITPQADSVTILSAERESYIRERLKDPWYHARYEIRDQITARIQPEQIIIDELKNDSPKNDEAGSAGSRHLPPDAPAVSDSKTIVDTPKTKRKSLFDLGDQAEQFIRNNSPLKTNGGDREDDAGETD